MRARLALFQAAFWAVVGVVLFTIAYEEGGWYSRAAWAALVLCLFNVVRWWVLRPRPSSVTSMYQERGRATEPTNTSFKLIDEPEPPKAGT